MKNKYIIINLTIFVSFFQSSLLKNHFSQNVIEINQPLHPPQWAILEQDLLTENLKFLELVTVKYINPVTGYLECIEHWGGADGPDDAMENFYNWSLLYALGAPARTLEIFNFIWNGHIDQYTNTPIRDPRGSQVYYKEFISAYDWEHTGEGIAPFLLLPLSDPEETKTMERIVRFADFYTGRDTSTHNYDPEHKIMRSVFTGSRGPWLSATPEQMMMNNNSWRTRGTDGVMGDVPLNLISTSLAVNAYMLTGDDHYKNWVLEYTTAWLDRTVQNNWVIPSNVGLNGIVGEHWENKWYGGIMGWDWNFGGFRILGRGMRIGFGNGYFLTGDPEFLEALRKQGDILLDNRVIINNQSYYLDNYGAEEWFLPLNAPVEDLTSWYGRDRSNNGWYDPRLSRELGDHFTDLYMWSLQEEDLERIDESLGDQIDPWIEFLQGNNSDYPETVLQNELVRLEQLSASVNADQSLPSERLADHGTWPAATSALVNLTLGGLQPAKSGGLLYCQLRYFNPVAKRPGLPSDLGALIRTIDSEKVILTLVNTNSIETRNVIVQAGAYGEHQCSKIIVANEEYPIHSNHFTVRLAPSSGSDITIYLNRYSNQPTLAFPWNQMQSKCSPAENIQCIINFPNPFTLNTQIVFKTIRAGHAKMSIYDIRGVYIETLCDQKFTEGTHQIRWNPKNLSSGVYLCVLENGAINTIKKMVLMK